MTEQSYAPPQANLNQETSADDFSLILEPLKQTQGWVRLLSILGFISAFFIAIGILGMLVAGTASMGQMQGNPFGGAMIFFMVIIYGIMFVINLMCSIYLFKYASAIHFAHLNPTFENIATALQKQKSFWKLVGVMALIWLVLMVVGLVAAIAIPFMM